MKKILLCLLSLSLPLLGANGPALPDISDAAIKKNQLTLIDNLIEVTKKNLENEKQLRQLVQEYLQIQAVYLQNPSNKDQTLKMVKMAHTVLEKINETNLIQAFDSEFISELNFFSQIAAKRGLPSPE